MRYRYLLLFLLGVSVLGVVVEAILRFFGAEISLTDRSGPGEMLVFAVGLAPIGWFSMFIAGVNPFAFVSGYISDWRRVIRGFLFTFTCAVTTMVLIYLALGLFGTFRWSPGAWAKLTNEIWLKVIFAVVVGIVLATFEELIFRAFILRYLRWNSSTSVTVAAVVASSVIFSLSHIIALRAETNGALLFGLFLIGVLLGTAYVVTGSLACSIGIHSGLLAFKIVLSRTELIVSRPDWLSGAGADLRTGPGPWLLLLLAIGGLVYWRHWLSSRFRVETAVCAEKGASGGIGFRLEAATT